MAGFIKLICTCEPSGTGSHNGYSFVGSPERRLWNNPCFLEPAIHNGAFDTLNRHWIVVDSQHTRPFARRRTDSPCELWKVISLMKQFQRLTPVACVNQVIPIGNEIVKRTTGSRTIQNCSRMTERYATIHTARC